jgi:hypothetical protein
VVVVMRVSFHGSYSEVMSPSAQWFRVDPWDDSFHQKKLSNKSVSLNSNVSVLVNYLRRLQKATYWFYKDNLSVDWFDFHYPTGESIRLSICREDSVLYFSVWAILSHRLKVTWGWDDFMNILQSWFYQELHMEAPATCACLPPFH